MTPKIITRDQRASRRFGLGDAVALIAQPTAKAIDKVAGTRIQACGPCQNRKRALNNLFSVSLPPKKPTT